MWKFFRENKHVGQTTEADQSALMSREEEAEVIITVV